MAWSLVSRLVAPSPLGSNPYSSPLPHFLSLSLFSRRRHFPIRSVLRSSFIIFNTGEGAGVQDPFPSPPRSFLSLVTGAQHIPEKAKGNGGGRKTGSMYRGGGKQSLRNSLCQKGAAHTALTHLARGGQKKGLPPPSLNSFPSQTGPRLCGMGGRRRRTEASVGS